MKKHAFAALLAWLFIMTAFAIFISPPRANAITYGEIDSDNSYSNTGAFIVKSANTGRIFPLCSGTLIAPDVFLTAAHCTEDFLNRLAPAGFTAFVSFDGLIPFRDNTDPDTTNLIEVNEIVQNPEYNRTRSDSGDMAALILSEIPEDITPATLPTLRLLDELAERNGLKDAVFTPVGYGLQDRVVGGGTPFFQNANPVPRMFASSSFNALNPGFLRLSQNPATGNGGTCSGDSGGPNFLDLDGQLILVGITIGGDTVCRATSAVYRLDIPSAREFLEQFVDDLP